MSATAGTGVLARLVVRRDRLRLGVWVGAQVLLAAATASSYASLYPTVESRRHFADLVADNPALLAVYGPARGFDELGALTGWRFVPFGAILAGVMSLLTVVRHTRAEEEAGRQELVGAGVVGRHAPLAAALLAVLGTNLVLAALLVAGLVGSGLPAAGALAVGLTTATAGLVFAGVAAVIAQLSESPRTAGGAAAAVLGAAFLLRAVADSQPGLAWLSWLSPLGWAQQVHAFTGERWWVLALPVASAVVLAAVAHALAAGRDMGAGLLPQRPGPAHAGRRLASAFALAWRLQRGFLLAWTAGLVVVAAATASLAKGADRLLDGNQQLTELVTRMGGRHGAQDALLATFMGLIGVFTAVYAVQATLRLRSEETGQRSEPVLATGVGRVRWVASHLVFAVAGTAVVLVVCGLAAGLVHGLRSGDVAGQVPRLVGAALVQLPAVWTVTGITLALFGLAPRLAVASWGVVVAFLLLGEFGTLLGLDQRVMDVSPFTHVPKLPGGQVDVTPLLVLGAVAVALSVAGLAGFRRRDVG